MVKYRRLRDLADSMKLISRHQIHVASVLIVLLIWFTTSSSAYAHGFGQRYDLPVPLWLYITGAGAAVALSFVIIGLFLTHGSPLLQQPRFNFLQWCLSNLIAHPLMLRLLQTTSVFIFLGIIIAGFFGDPEPTNNAAPTMVWVIFWVGLAFISALIGNFWPLINPWNAIYQLLELGYKRFSPNRRFSLNFPYPKALGVWPGFVLFFIFAWIELVFQGSSLPINIARLIVMYTGITWVGMWIFGRKVWLQHGEFFTLIFGFISRFSPTEICIKGTEACYMCEDLCITKDNICTNCLECFNRAPTDKRQVNLRLYAVGLLKNEPNSPSVVALLLLLLSTLTFDGFTATPLWADIHDSVYSYMPNSSAVGTLGLLVFPCIFGLVYLLFSRFVSIASRTSYSIGAISSIFIYSLIPIAIAYHLAHFFSFLLVQGQLIIPLASDPFGFGWDLFNTVDYRINIAIVNARFAWFISVVAIVIGHIIAVYLAHVIALRTFETRVSSLMSQLPMLVLMVGYTMLSLWILAQPIVET
ncbi:hypothetical protein FIM12_05260 [SAR202 cluster bacterium AD-804-J14_MRT_500m]|nr:hypothetical protein [SAR202 cluster bacterium AD-804-J14_MRT_500m]